MAQVGISNSEAMNAYACEYAWGFGHHPEMNYSKKGMTDARERGVVGHAALETYYKGLRDGEDHDTSAHAALEEIQRLRREEVLAEEFGDPGRLAMLNWLYQVLEMYFEHYENDSKYWEILEVEAFHAQEQEGEADFYLPSRLDVTIYQKGGRFKGETSPLDHKFTDQFWTDAKLNLNSQFPLYILAVRAARFAGKPKPVVRRVIVNQIRTRLKNLDDVHSSDIFKRSFKDYSETRLRTVFENHMKSAVKLAYYKRLSWEEFLSEARAALGSMACQYCDFKDLCDVTFERKDPSTVIAATLTRNEYGYPPLEEIRSERR